MKQCDLLLRTMWLLNDRELIYQIISWATCSFNQIHLYPKDRTVEETSSIADQDYINLFELMCRAKLCTG